jgi:DNA adenine methylase
MTKLNSQPLKWHGGKSYLADWIIGLMPPHLHYVEPYFGGGAVLLARDQNRDWLIDDAWKLANGDKVPAHLKGCSEVVNDINFDLTNFWCALKHPELFIQFQRIVLGTPFSQWEFERSKPNAFFEHVAATLGEEQHDASCVASAAKFFIRYRQSRQGLGKDFATLSRNRTRGRRNEQANSWLSTIEGLPEIHERLKGVVIINSDALKVIKQQDGESTLFYCDPPYLHETRSSTGEYGVNEMTEEQHDELLVSLAKIKGKFMLSGYHSTMYDEWAAAYGFNCHEREIDNKASSAKEKEKKIECVWCNF